MGSIVEPANNILYTPYSIKFLAYMIFQAIGVYFNLYYLVPKFLEKGRYVMYGSLLLMTILTTAAATVSGYYAAAFFSGKPFQELFGRESSDYWFFFKTYSLPSTVACMTLGMSIKLTKNWIQSTRRQQLLEKEKLETELKFLKSQFNPHFLFNTINSIFFLIHKNPMLASNALAKFSDLLRFQLYECNEKQIPLSHELTYLENFIELQKLRFNKNVNISLDIDAKPKYDLAIAPFVLITFTENAFKHLSDFSDQPNWIKVKLRWNETDFQFNISNSVDTFKKKDVLNYGGLGLKNIKRRLDLIYPEQYRLEILSGTNSFEVQLNLKLTEIIDAVVIHKSA
jgi:LytS/YehU family sensor histidine kinase